MSEALLGDTLDDALEALHLELDRGQRKKLIDYVALLAKWNRTYNLTAIRQPLDMMRQHVVDCLAVVPSLRAQLTSLPSGSRQLVDVGSGAGLPGLVFAVALPELRVACVDSVGKKTSFIAQAAASLAIDNATAHHSRVESFRPGTFDVVASRALGSLPDLLATTEHLLSPGGQWMAMKGLHPSADLTVLDSRYVFHVEPVHVPGLDATRCVAWIGRQPESERTLMSERSS